MDTAPHEAEHDQSPDQQMSGELHLPSISNTGTLHVVPPTQPERIASPLDQAIGDSAQHVFYLQDDLSLEEDDADAFGSPMATSFQMSSAMPTVRIAGQSTQQTPSPSVPQSRRRLPVVRILLLAVVIVIILTTGAMAFAQSSPTAALPDHTVPTTTAVGTMPMAKPTQAKRTTPVARPMNPPTTITGQQNGTGSWLPQPLPTGWTNAGLSMGDALFGERTAIAFTDREMSLDYRSVGTRAHHGGTFTAAIFALTANAKARFAQDDVRVINNVLFDTVQQEKRIQSVVNAQPQLVKFVQQGQQHVAWVEVSFHLWQSKIDATGTRTEGFDLDPATKQPRMHHMMVVLLRVPQATQGDIPAMGGTGWLVSAYALDLPAGTALDLVQPA